MRPLHEGIDPALVDRPVPLAEIEAIASIVDSLTVSQLRPIRQALVYGKPEQSERALRLCNAILSLARGRSELAELLGQDG